MVYHYSYIRIVIMVKVLMHSMMLMAMEDEDGLIRARFEGQEQRVLNLIAQVGPQGYQNIKDADNNIVATVMGEKMVTYYENEGRTVLIFRSIEQMNTILGSKYSCSEQKPLLVEPCEKEYAQTVMRMGVQKHRYFSEERDKLLWKNRKKVCCWSCCLY